MHRLDTTVIFFSLTNQTIEKRHLVSLTDKKGLVVFHQTRGGRGKNAIRHNCDVFS